MIDFAVAHIQHYWGLLSHFAGLSLLSVGGPIMLASAMQQYLVNDTDWLSGDQFNAAISISQAAPGPNVLFVSLMGWYAGSNWLLAHNPQAGLLTLLLVGGFTAVLTLCCMIVPSTALNFFVGRWVHRHQARRSVKAFKQGMSPIVIALLIATGWVMARAHGDWQRDAAVWLLTAVATLLAWRTQLHVLWLLAAGAVAGALGWV